MDIKDTMVKVERCVKIKWIPVLPHDKAFYMRVSETHILMINEAIIAYYYQPRGSMPSGQSEQWMYLKDISTVERKKDLMLFYDAAHTKLMEIQFITNLPIRIF